MVIVNNNAVPSPFVDNTAGFKRSLSPFVADATQFRTAMSPFIVEVTGLGGGVYSKQFCE